MIKAVFLGSDHRRKDRSTNSTSTAQTGPSRTDDKLVNRII